MFRQSLKSPTIKVGRWAAWRKSECSSRCFICQCRSCSARPRCQCTRWNGPSGLSTTAICAPRGFRFLSRKDTWWCDWNGQRDRSEVAVAAVLQPHVELVKVGHGVEGLGQLTRLVVVPRSPHVPIDLLEADQVGILVLDDLDDPFQAVAAVATADAFMDVVAQESHGHPSWCVSGQGNRSRRRCSRPS